MTTIWNVVADKLSKQLAEIADAHEAALKEDRERAWAARELGDVPYERLTPFPEANPVVFVESLGRES